MSNFLRTTIFQKVISPLQNIKNVYQDKIMSNLYVRFNNVMGTYSFEFPAKAKDYDVTNEIKHITQNDLENTCDNVILKDDVMYFNIPRDKYIKEILENNLLGVTPPLLVENNKNIVIEFSSPNIAKPFHFGHLRSTLLGNVIANINTFLQNQVTKVNYLGDWGTQFGYVQLGLEMTNIDNIEMQADPIKTLYNVYVNANKLAKDNPEIHEKAKEIFKQLELEENTVSKNWQKIRDFTTLELQNTYKRIGVTFDKYNWESTYAAKNITDVINAMEKMQLLIADSYDRRVISLNEKVTVPILKSDGTTLYMARDIAAAIDRFEKEKFDAMYYVVDNSQSYHFSNLFHVLNKMKLPWADRLTHVKFGRVHGMSTRKGTAIFLEDILNEAKEMMKQKQLETKTTKTPEDQLEATSDILGVSGIIVQDLKHKKISSYDFNYKSMLDLKGDSGIKLQYTHCRLYNLEECSYAVLPTKCNPSLLKEPEVDHLIAIISQFDEAVIKSYQELEPCILVIYLFHLCNSINLAFRKLNVKHVSEDVGSQRLLLFHVARIILAQGMKLLGLTPLEKM